MAKPVELMMKEIEALARCAADCRYCFQRRLVDHALIKVAQPPWIGLDYLAANPRVGVVNINPGAGTTVDFEVHRARADLINAFAQRKMSLREVLKEQRKDMARWGRDRYIRFLNDRNLELDGIAIVNLAWCATQGNKHPQPMLRACLERHTGSALEHLAPHGIILCGNRVQALKDDLQRLLPTTPLHPTLHYAHRNGHDADRSAAAAVRGFVDGLGPQ
jgi:hypothetical protein